MFLKSLHRAWQSLLGLLYPQLCLGCNRILLDQETILCLECKTTLPYTSYHNIVDNETVSRFTGRVIFRHATSLAYYTKDGILQYLLEALKYKGNQEVGVFMGKELANALAGAEWIGQIDLILCVPLHPDKMKARGYNQCTRIAETAAQILGLPFFSAGLVRVKNTGTQTKKSRYERAENMKGAFALAASHPFEGKHVLLIDDVLTTGATLEACMDTLSGVKGIQISVATIGIAVH